MKAISSAESLLLSPPAPLQRLIPVSNQYCCGRMPAATQSMARINPRLMPNPASAVSSDSSLSLIRRLLTFDSMLEAGFVFWGGGPGVLAF